MAINNHLIQGKAMWCKIVGAPVPGYQNGPPEWTFDLVIDKDTQKKLLKIGVAPQYLKDNADGETFVRFTRKATKRDGSEGKPIKIVDHKNQDWGTDLIGNGSILNVSFTLNPVGAGTAARLKPSVLAVQVWNLEKYSPKATFKTREDLPSQTEETWTEEEDQEAA